MSKLPISNNKLIDKYYEVVDFPHEEAWEDEAFGEDTGNCCTICSTVIESDRAGLIYHLMSEHKTRILSDLATKQETQ